MGSIFPQYNQRYSLWYNITIIIKLINMYKLTENDISKIVSIIFFALLILSLTVKGNSQSIMVDNQNRLMLVMSEEEKAIKSSSSCIKAKQDIKWETHINSVKIIWEIKYIKDTKIYTLYKNSIKHYESSTITGIRSKYASDLLGREIKIQ